MHMLLTAYAFHCISPCMPQLDTLLSALSHPARRSALRLLAGGDEHCLCELMDRLGVSQSSMSRHMACLKEVGLISDRRDAQWMRYRRRTLDDPILQAVVDAVLAASDDPPLSEGTSSCQRSAA